MRSMLLSVILALSSGLSWAATAAVAPAEAAAETPGDVALAALAAQRSGIEQWKQAWHPRTWQGKEEETRKFLDQLRESSPILQRRSRRRSTATRPWSPSRSFDGSTATAPVD